MTNEFDAFLLEQFAPLGDIRIKRMFGGLGVFKGELMFALVAYDVLHFKADETTIPAFEAEGCGPFVYEGKGRTVTMSYWKAPERLFDEPDEFRQWAADAYAVALRASAGKQKKPKGARPGKAG
ncbi:MAG: TfoX/Sxy family protein [Hyphomicrobiales bacterium]